jgi:prefoldin subunit 5
MTKKNLDTLAVLEAQRDSAMERIKDPYYRDQVEWLQGQIEKLNTLIRKIKG